MSSLLTYYQDDLSALREAGYLDAELELPQGGGAGVRRSAIPARPSGSNGAPTAVATTPTSGA